MEMLAPLILGAVMGAICPPDTGCKYVGGGYLLEYSRSKPVDLPAPVEILGTAEGEGVRFSAEIGESVELGAPACAWLVVMCGGQQVLYCNLAGTHHDSCTRYSFTLHRDFVGEAAFTVSWRLPAAHGQGTWVRAAPDSALPVTRQVTRPPRASAPRYAGVSFALREYAPQVGD